MSLQYRGQGVASAKFHSSGRVSSVANTRYGFGNCSSNKVANVQTAKSNGHCSLSDRQNLQGKKNVSGELLCGPRSNRSYDCVKSGYELENLDLLIRRDQFNKADFQIKYEHAKFYMIKCLSEDDIHKSIKYNVWSSTQYGNKKLDAVYWDAEQKSKEKGSKCPIFMFFSVNASWQFVGVAEMIGPVDFKKNMSFWQQEYWNGFFPVKWHFIKDIPNRLFHGIILENNENRSVTCSRDTQEILLPQGLRMLNLFKEYPVRSSILDDFGFYEKREKTLRATRNKQSVLQHQGEQANANNFSVEHLETSVSKMHLSATPIQHSNSNYSRAFKSTTVHASEKSC